MPKIKLESNWLKANNNVRQGDRIKFLDEGAKNEKGDWIFTVAVIDQRTGLPSAQKKFQLNRRNFEAIVAALGTDNSDDWVGKEMPIYVVRVENPRDGKMVDSVRLYDPSADTLDVETSGLESPHEE